MPNSITNTEITVTVTDDLIITKTPYHTKFPPLAKRAGATWLPNSKMWAFPIIAQQQVYKILNDVYGWNGEGIEIISTTETTGTQDDAILLGQTLVQKWDKDYGIGEPDEVDDYHVIITRDPLQGWGNDYTLRQGRDEGEIDAYSWVRWDKVQVRKGQERQPLLVIDLGEYRAACRI